MTFYAFPQNNHDDHATRLSVAFCEANGITPRAPIFGSTFEVTDDGWILTKEFELANGHARIWHEGCCGSTHFAKTNGRHALVAKPEDYGFTALLDASGNVAP
jgi:hypothetical protein